MTWGAMTTALNCINNTIIARFHKLVKWLFGCAGVDVKTPEDLEAHECENCGHHNENPTKGGPVGGSALQPKV